MKKIFVYLVILLTMVCVLLFNGNVNTVHAQSQTDFSLTELYYTIEEEQPELSHEEILDLMYQYIFETNTFSNDDYLGTGVNDEEFWVIVLNLWPSQYDTALEVKNFAVTETIRHYGENQWANDSDAFRHTYFAALLSYEFGTSFALELTTAHEAYTEDPLDKKMDLHNNSRGITLYDVWNSDFKSNNEEEHWTNLSDFITHCVSFGDIYNILKFDSTTNPTKLIYTSIGIPNQELFVLPYTKVTITQHDYNYEQQYFYYEKSLPITINDYTFNTKRLRTGYIEEEYIVLSPRRLDAGQAYLEYTFNDSIREIDVELTLWSTSEYLTLETSEALIQYKDQNGAWVTCLDLLNDISLSTDRTKPDNYRIVFPEDIYSFRFYITSSAYGDRNKGRVCIGNMSFYINYEVHEHEYTYLANGSTGHTATCSCGETYTQAHAVRTGESTSRYANCIQCGYLVDLTTDFVIGMMSVDELLYSENGSYILKNGVIVLVDEDIEAYLNGTLTFNKEEDGQELS